MNFLKQKVDKKGNKDDIANNLLAALKGKFMNQVE